MGCGGRQRLLFAVMNLVAGYICDVAGYNCDVKCNISVVGVGGGCSAGSDNGWISNAVAVIYSEGNSSCGFFVAVIVAREVLLFELFDARSGRDECGKVVRRELSGDGGDTNGEVESGLFSLETIPSY